MWMFLFQPQIKIRDASVTVRPDWSTIEEMDFPRLSKLSLPGIGTGTFWITLPFVTQVCEFVFVIGEDIICCGELEYYDKGYDRVNVKNEKPLQRIDRIFHTVILSSNLPLFS